MDEALALAARVQPDIVLANDPDADRCAVAVPDLATDGGWRLLRGDELGALLGSHIVMRGVPEGHAFACSIVSSRASTAGRSPPKMASMSASDSSIRCEDS